MAVRIRMKRMGRKHRPFFRICVMDSQKPRDGKAIEEVGSYDPMVRDKADRVKLKMDRIDYWISVGAQPSDNVATLIKKVQTQTFGTASAPPPLTPPKAPPAPEPTPEESAETPATDETPAADEPSEEASAAPDNAEAAQDGDKKKADA